MSAPLDDSSTTTGRRSSSAAPGGLGDGLAVAGGQGPDLGGVPDPTSTIDRGPCTVSRVSIDAWTMPGTLARSRSAARLAEGAGLRGGGGGGEGGHCRGCDRGSGAGVTSVPLGGAERW